MKVIVIGANGCAGTDIVEEFLASGNEVVALTHADIEVANRENVLKVLNQPFDVLVNSTCLLARACEADPERAYGVNAMGASYLAEAALARQARIVHISTEMVFDGKKGSPYTESDAPNPNTVYGNVKLAGEYFVRNSGADYQILRTSCLFGDSPTRTKPGGL